MSPRTSPRTWTLGLVVALAASAAPICGAHAQSAAPAAAARQHANPYLEKLSRDNSVIVYVDYLTGFEPGIRTVDLQTYRNRVDALVTLGETFRLPSIVLGDEGGFRGQFMEPVRRILPKSPTIPRHTPSAWAVPAFREALARAGRPKVIMAGISIDNCVLQTALDVMKAGYQVYVVVDVSGSDTELNEQAAILRLTQAGAVPTNWVSLAAELMGDWNTPEGEVVGRLYQQYTAWGGQPRS